MPNVSVVPNANLQRKGQQLVREAKEHQLQRRNASRKITNDSVKDMCGFFKAKAIERTTFQPLQISQKKWNRIFKTPSTHRGTATAKGSK